MIRFLALLLLLLPSFGLAEDLVFGRRNPETASYETFPAFYDVTRVEDDAKLTHRAHPSWDAERVGGPTYGLIDRNVEIVALSLDQAWGLTTNDLWLPLEFLTRKPARFSSVRPDWEVPAEFPVKCGPGAPYWAMTINPNGTYIYTSGTGDRRSGRLTYTPSDEGILSYSYHGLSDDGSTEVAIVVTRTLCTTPGWGSNRHAFGFVAELDLETPLGQRQSGFCCNLVP